MSSDSENIFYPNWKATKLDEVKNTKNEEDGQSFDKTYKRNNATHVNYVDT